MEEWPSDLAFLQELEEPMKCPICFDLMKAPVILPSCEHNYCSLCIRRYFCQREQCPTCGSPASSNQLRTNGIMEKTIEQFKKIRSPLRSLCLNKLPQTQTQMQSGCHSGKQALLETNRYTPRPKRSTRSCKSEDVGNGLGTASKSRKRPASQSGSDSEDSDVQILSSEDENCSFSSPKVYSSASHLRPSVLSLSASPNQTESMKPRNVQSKLFVPGDGSKTSAKENSGAKGESAARTASSREASPKAASPLAVSRRRNSNSGAAASSSPKVSSPLMMSPSKGDMKRGSSSPGGVPEVEKVPCPVCGVPVVTSSVNRHLDLCLGRQEKQAAQKEKKKPLPKLVYNLLSDKDIRKRLKDLGLASKGDRQALIKRHHEFTLYHNADCDSIAPKEMNELVKEFEEAQKVQTKLLSKSSASSQSILRFTKDSKQEDIEKARKEYAAQHKDHFKSLIKEAKIRMKSARKTQSASTCSTSTAPGPDNCTSVGISGQKSESRLTSDTTVYKERTTGGDIVVIDSDIVCNTEVEVPDGEIVCTNEVRMISETKKLMSCVPESDDDDDVRNGETHQEEISESQTTAETVLSKTQTSSAIDNNNSDALSDDVVMNKEACEDTVGLSSQLKMVSTKLQDETAAVTDIFREVAGLGEENSSDVFECDPKSKCVLAKTSVRGRGKRPLRSAKPSWQETDATELPMSPDRSQTSHRPQAKLHKPNQNQTSHFNSQEKTLSSDSCIAISVDGSCQGSSHTYEPQRFSAESESERTVLRQKRSPTQFPRSHSKFTVTGTDSVNDSSLRESAEPSDECPANPDREVMNAEPAASESSSINKTGSDHPQNTAKQSEPEVAGELTHMLQENRASRTRNQRTRGKGRKGTKSLGSERDTEAYVTNVHALTFPREDEEGQNSEDMISSSREVNRLNDSHTNTSELSETEEKPCPKKCDTADHPGTTGVHLSKNSTECFELNLSDCEDDALYSAENEVESTSFRSTALPQNGQGQEFNSRGEADPKNISRTAHETNASHSRKGDTENVGEASPSLTVLEMDQETESESKSLPITKLKSLLKKKCTNETMLKKSVRFAGLHARLSDIQSGGCDHKIVKERPDGKTREKGHARQFADNPVSRDEAAFLAHLRKTGCQGKRSQVGKADSTESEENMFLEAEGADVPLEAEGDSVPLEAEGDDLPLEAEGDDLPLLVSAVHEINECPVPSQLTSSENQCMKTERSGAKQKKVRNRKSACDAADRPVECIKTSTSLQTCDPTRGDPLEEKEKIDQNSLKETTKRKKDQNSLKETTKGKKKKHSGLPTDPVDFTHLKLPDDERNYVIHRASNSPKDSVSGSSQTLVTQDKESDTECQHREGDTRQTTSEAKPNLPATSSSAREEPQVVENSLSQNSQEKCAENISEESTKQKPQKSHPAKSVSQTVTDCPGGIEKPEEMNHPKSRQRRKRTNSSVGKCDQHTEAAEPNMQTETTETAPKRRKTSQSRNKDAEPSLLTETAETAPKRRKTSQSRNKDAEPSLPTETTETAPKRRKTSQSRNRDVLPTIPETITDLGQSSELKHQNCDKGILQTIPETSSDSEKPSKTEHRNRKQKSSKS